MRFTKVESVGNDYVLFDAVEEPRLARLADLTQWAQILSHRRTGVGADGLLILTKDADALAMRVINADGSDGGVCGNGLRSAVKLAIERGHAEPDEHGDVRVRIGERTLVATPKYAAGEIVVVGVDMGPPAFGPGEIPIDPGVAVRTGDTTWSVGGRELHCASMGNPHAVLFEAHTEVFPAQLLMELGPAISEHEAFPARTNAHIAQVKNRETMRVVSWERGAGPTQGCGTGVCASVALAQRAGLVDRAVTVDVPGGRLHCAWTGEPDAGVRLQGPARIVFTGEWPDEQGDGV